MKTLLTAYRVSDLERSEQFYRAVGFREIGRGPIGDGTTLAMLNLPGDGDFVTLELVYAPAAGALAISSWCVAEHAARVSSLRQAFGGDELLAGAVACGVAGHAGMPASPDDAEPSADQDADGAWGWRSPRASRYRRAAQGVARRGARG
jgi:catechol 2,3-dioxygenase-like lactoylglutathione lyase family enzyme